MTEVEDEHFHHLHEAQSANTDCQITITKVIYNKGDIPNLCSNWLEKCKDIMSGVPSQLPPMRAVNHQIPLIDDNKRHCYYLSRCPESMTHLLQEKIKRYTAAGWWKPTSTPQAAPMLCIPKKSGKLRTVVDCRKRNENTVKDVTPLPDQDRIRMDVARAKYRSKIDLSDAYEQVRIVPEDVWKTSFSTIFGNFVSLVMQQGDCNAPATFQQLMTTIFRDYIGVFMHVYLDDIFVFSSSIEEHEEHLEKVFSKLRDSSLYLMGDKCDLYSDKMDCLGHVIDDKGLHADADKMSKVRQWRTPRSQGDIQRFLGLVQYLAHFMPDVSAYTGPLSSIARGGQPFHWRPIHDKCFESIKMLACKTPILKPIDPSLPEPIWIICDGSTSGVGAMFGQGPDWRHCRPAGFMSKKFTTAQHAYRVFETETLAILEALLKWEDKLLGRKIQIISDHKALEFFKNQRKLSSRQTRWMEYLSRFDYDIQFIPGEMNKVADCLSRYYENDEWDEKHSIDQYVNADVRLDPEGEDLPQDRLLELNSMRVRKLTEKGRIWAAKHAKCHDHVEVRQEEAQALHDAAPPVSAQAPITEDPQLFGPTDSGPPLRQLVETTAKFLHDVKQGYHNDTLLSKVLATPSAYPLFHYKDHLLWTMN